MKILSRQKYEDKIQPRDNIIPKSEPIPIEILSPVGKVEDQCQLRAKFKPIKYVLYNIKKVIDLKEDENVLSVTNSESCSDEDDRESCSDEDDRESCSDEDDSKPEYCVVREYRPIIKEDLNYYIWDIFEDDISTLISMLHTMMQTFGGIVVATFMEMHGKLFEHQQNEQTLDSFYTLIHYLISNTHPIELGLCFYNSMGIQIKFNGYLSLQIHFQFDRDRQVYSNKTIESLVKYGLNLDENLKRGVNKVTFQSMMNSTGLISNGRITWVGFHTCLDWGYMLKMMLDDFVMPEKRGDFIQLISQYFPRILDLRCMPISRNNHRKWNGDLDGLIELQKVKIDNLLRYRAGGRAFLMGGVFWCVIDDYMIANNLPMCVWSNLADNCLDLIDFINVL